MASNASSDDLDIFISRQLRAAMGHEDKPGSCQDCGGIGMVPNSADTRRPSWRPCPTCKGKKAGGRG